MSLYQRGKKGIWWYKFKINGQRICESTKTSNENLARRAERKRHSDLEEAYNGVTPTRPQVVFFDKAAKEWLNKKSLNFSESSMVIQRRNLKHLLPVFGKKLLCDLASH